MKRGQNGFGAIEALLFLILLSTLGFTGYYVYHSRNNANSTYDNASKSASSTPTTSSSKFVFKELGVQIPLPKALEGLSYETDDLGSSTALELTTPRFTELANICWAHDPVHSHAFQTVIKKTSQYGSDGYVGTNLKQFDNFYIGGNDLPSFDCEDSSNQQRATEFKQLGADLNSALNSAFKNATLVQ